MSLEEVTADNNREIGVPDLGTPDQVLAITISEMNNNKTSHLIGVLLTIIDASIPNSEQLQSMKSLIRRELYNDQHERVSAIHSIVSRADVVSFRKHPTLDEQYGTAPFDHTVFDKYEQ